MLLPGEVTFGWLSSKQTFVSTNSSWDWKGLSPKLDEFVSATAPTLTLVQLSVKLQELVKEVERVVSKKKGVAIPASEAHWVLCEEIGRASCRERV